MAARFLCGLAALVLLAACGGGSQARTAPSPPVSPSAASSFAAPQMEPNNAAPMAGSRIATVYFANLPAGSYPVHLHDRCNAGPGFHITVIGYLAVAADGQGAISVPARDFGRGWCLIVYSSATLGGVLTTRAI